MESRFQGVGFGTAEPLEPTRQSIDSFLSRPVIPEIAISGSVVWPQSPLKFGFQGVGCGSARHLESTFQGIGSWLLGPENLEIAISGLGAFRFGGET